MANILSALNNLCIVSTFRKVLSAKIRSSQRTIIFSFQVFNRLLISFCADASCHDFFSALEFQTKCQVDDGAANVFQSFLNACV